MTTKLNPRHHPVRLLLDHLAFGGELTIDDLAELQLADAAPRERIEAAIRAAAVEIAEARADGNRGEARAIARNIGEALVELDVGLHARHTPNESPADLARLVPRGIQ